VKRYSAETYFCVYFLVYSYNLYSPVWRQQQITKQQTTAIITQSIQLSQGTHEIMNVVKLRVSV